MSAIEIWELLSYVVTVVGLPLAIFTYWQEQRKERENEDEETYDQLSVAYTDFLKLVMANPDLQLRSRQAAAQLTDEQLERRQVVFEMLVSLFERAYLLAYDDDMTEKQRRRWHSWDDYMREWCRRPDFRDMLPQLLQGEDPDFVTCIQGIARQESMSSTPARAAVTVQ
jgi:thymidylate synthase ThyX